MKITSFFTMPLWQQMLWGMLLGLGAGLTLSTHGLALVEASTADHIKDWLSLPGYIFLAMIKMIVIPLVMCSIALAICGAQNVNHLKDNSLKVGGYFIFTTCVAVLIGISLNALINPAQYIDPALLLTPDALSARGSLPDLNSKTHMSLPKMISNILPSNPAKSVVDFNMLHVVVASLFLGVALLTLSKKRAKPIIDLLNAGLDVTMKIVIWAMAIAPLAVFGFLAALAIQTGPEMITALSTYIATVLMGLVSLLLFYAILIKYIAKRPVIPFFKNIRDAQILAFSTSSSAATMPLSLKIADEKLNIDPKVSGFIIPLGTTINMDGTAIYQMIAGLFLAEIFGVDLSFAETLLLAVTIVGASIGSPGTPGVGLVILATILTSLGVSPEGIAMILSVDRLLDMCRTTINVTGDLTASAVMNRLFTTQNRKK